MATTNSSTNNLQITVSVNDLATIVLRSIQNAFRETAKAITDTEQQSRLFNNTLNKTPNGSVFSTYEKNLKNLNKALANSTKSFAQANRHAETLNSSFSQIPNRAQTAERGIELLKTSLVRFAGAYAGWYAGSNTATDFIKTAAEFQQIDSRLKALVDTNTQLAETWEYLWNTSGKLSINIKDMSDNYAKLLALEKAGILTTNDARKMLEGFSDVAALTGASANNLRLSLFGLAQGLSTGTLRAEELNQVTEPMPGILQALDRAAQLPAGGFRQLVVTGQVTSEMFRTTLIKAFEEYEGAAVSMANNITPTYTRMGNAYTHLKQTLEEPISIVVVPWMQAVTGLLANMTRYFEENKEEIIATTKAFVKYTSIIGAAIVSVIQFVTDNKELLLVLGSTLVAMKLVSGGLTLFNQGVATSGPVLSAVTGTFKNFYNAFIKFLRIEWRDQLIRYHGFFKGMSVYISLYLAKLTFRLKKLIAFLASINLGTLFSTIVASMTAMAVQINTLITGQLLLWFTSGASGALALASALGKLALVVAAGFAVYEIIKLTKALFGLYQARRTMREASEEQAYMEGRLSNKLAEVSKQLGLVIPDMQTFNKLVREGIIQADIETGQWIRAKDIRDAKAAIVDYRKQIQDVEELITQKTNVLSQKRISIAKEERRKSYDLLKDMLSDRASIDVEIIRNTELTLKEIEYLHRKSTQRIKDLYRDLADERRSFQDAIAAVTRRDLAGEDEKLANLRLQIAEKLTAGKKALAKEEFKTAIQISKEIKRIVLNESRKTKGKILFSDESIPILKQSLAIVEEAIKKQIEKTKKFKAEIENKKLVVTAEITQAEAEIERLKQKLQELKDKTVTVTVQQKNTYQHGGEVVVPKMAEGGWIPGTGNADNVPALLTPGEFVIQKSRSAIFKRLLELINFGSLPDIKKILNLSLLPKFDLNQLVREPKTLPIRYAQGGEVNKIRSTNVETIRLEWQINSQGGQIETLMGQRQNLNAFVNAINNAKRGL